MYDLQLIAVPGIGNEATDCSDEMQFLFPIAQVR